MSTEKIASDLDEIADELHELDYGEGNLFATLRRMVDTMTELNNELTRLQKPENENGK